MHIKLGNSDYSLGLCIYSVFAIWWSFCLHGASVLCFTTLFKYYKLAGDLNNSSFSSFRRSGASEFIVPYWRFSKSLNHPFSIGMRFKDSNESDDANERSVLLAHWKLHFCTSVVEFSFLLCRSTGLISGISEVDPIRWPGSKWRCLQVYMWLRY